MKKPVKECYRCKRRDVKFKKYWDVINKEFGAIRVFCPECAYDALSEYFDDITK